MRANIMIFICNRRITITIFLLLLIIKANGQVVNNLNRVENEQIKKYSNSEPIFKFSEEQSTNRYRHLRFSVISGYKEGAEPISGFGSFATVIDTVNGTKRIYMLNLSIQDLLTLGFNFPNNRFILEVKDKSKYRYSKDLGLKMDWMRDNTYCFEYLTSREVNIDANSLKQQIADHFGVTITKKKVLVEVLVLTRTSKNNHVITKDRNTKSTARTIPITDLSRAVDDMQLPRMVDESGYKENLDMNLNLDTNGGLLELNKGLEKYDLVLKEEKREMDMFVISEKSNKR